MSNTEEATYNKMEKEKGPEEGVWSDWSEEDEINLDITVTEENDVPIQRDINNPIPYQRQFDSEQKSPRHNDDNNDIQECDTGKDPSVDAQNTHLDNEQEIQSEQKNEPDYYAYPIGHQNNLDENVSGGACSGGLGNDQRKQSDNDAPANTQKRHLRRMPVKRKLINERNNSDEEGMSDDSLNDPWYDVTKDKESDTDENDMSCSSNHSQPAKKKKRKPKREVTEKSWKKKIKRLSQHKQQSSKKVHKNKNLYEKLKQRIDLYRHARKPKSPDCRTALEKAKQLSKRMHSIKETISRLHKNRIDVLLASNELKRVPVVADGNCFFSAIAYSIDDPLTGNIDAFRSSICDYMLEHTERFSSFMPVESSESQVSEFRAQVETLRESGQWNAKIADCLPLATAEKFNCILRIYSSSISTPVVDIKPSCSDADSKSVINLAYLAIKNEEHYEATTTMEKITAPKPAQCTVSAQETSLNEPGSAASTTVDDVGDENECENVNVTPHKRADYQSPKKKLSSRKKKRNVSQWKANIRKKARMEGKEYTSKKGKNVPRRSVKPQNCEKCRFKCNTKFSEDQREEIFRTYYSLESYERQRNFICDMVLKVAPARQTTGRKSKSLQYFLVIGDKRERVCQNFFLKTLDIGKKTVSYTIEKKKHGSFSGTDRRGRHEPSAKTTEDRIQFVREHINSFPKMESHYTRKNTSKQYLATDLSIKQMWSLYCSLCKQKGYEPVSQSKYRQIFCEDFNLSFFKPKKDQCALCVQYNRCHESGLISESLVNEYQEHQERKVQAREEKEKDKKMAKENEKYYVATFDLQAVLTTPCSLVSELYYSRKLCCYNLTFYSLRDKHVTCHLWDETHGKRGSCEVATCLMKQTQSVCSSAPNEHVTYFSDTCGGQNRNKYVAASFIYVISKCPRLKTLNQKFLQSGHSQMECDSVHATIEIAKKKTSIHVPSMWSTLIVNARKKNPYVTVPLKYDHIIDFKSFVQKQSLNFQTAVTGERINWLLVRWLQVRQDAPKRLFINYTFDDTKFLEVVTQHTDLRKKGRPVKWPETDADLDMSYSSKLPVTAKKKEDLTNLCVKNIIPEEFHGYFNGLKTSKSAKDLIPVSTSDEDSDFE